MGFSVNHLKRIIERNHGGKKINTQEYLCILIGQYMNNSGTTKMLNSANFGANGTVKANCKDASFYSTIYQGKIN